jgi:hypothetical protein
MNNVTVLPGQNLYDLAIQHCGSTEAAFEISKLNHIAITDTPAAGSIILVPDPYLARVVSALNKDSSNPATIVVVTEFGVGSDIIESNLIVA